ncbi:MAG TPA: rhodanese-like domain-containing protein [Solirubrobacterales bacterium]
MPTPTPLERVPPRPEPQRLPRALPERGLYVVDGSWGTLQPIQLAAGVRTVGELEVIEQIRRGRPLVDTRVAASHAEATLPTAVNIPRREVVARIAELATDMATVFFCNGPQCAATPASIRALLEAGHPPELIRYYRGGMHDWITLGLPVAGRRSRPQDSSSERPVIASG